MRVFSLRVRVRLVPPHPLCVGARLCVYARHACAPPPAPSSHTHTHVYSETKVLHAEQAKVAEVRLVFCNKNNFRDKVLQEEKAKVAALEQRCAYFEHLLRQTQCAVGGGGGGGGVMRPSGISPSASLPPPPPPPPPPPAAVHDLSPRPVKQEDRRCALNLTPKRLTKPIPTACDTGGQTH